MGLALTAISGSSSSSSSSATGALGTWPHLFEQASLARLRSAGSIISISGGGGGGKARRGAPSDSELGLDALAAYAHALATAGHIPGDEWLSAFVHKLNELLGLGAGQQPKEGNAAGPAVRVGAAGAATSPVAPAQPASAAVLAQLCGACAMFNQAKVCVYV